MQFYFARMCVPFDCSWMFEKAPNCMAGEKVGIKSNINEDDDKMNEASASMKDIVQR
jgi:hypothetical protein